MEAVVCISLEDQSIKFSKIHFEGWKLQHENECRDTNVWRSQIWRFFSDQPFPPPRPRPNSPMQRPPSLLRISNFFDYDPYPYPLPLPPTPTPTPPLPPTPTPTPTPYPLPPTPTPTPYPYPYPYPYPFPALPSNFAGKRGFICQGLQLAEYSFNHMLAYIAVGKKKVCCICLQWTTLTTQENEARNRNTSIGSQMILESWNIWSLNLSFLWATDPNFLLSGSFSHPCGRSAQNPGKLAFMWM